MTREEWLNKYNADPAFRLERLLKLKSRNYKKQGGFPRGHAYEADIERARKELEKSQ